MDKTTIQVNGQPMTASMMPSQQSPTATATLREAKGIDAPMTARLGRLLIKTHGAGNTAAGPPLLHTSREPRHAAAQEHSKVFSPSNTSAAGAPDFPHHAQEGAGGMVVRVGGFQWLDRRLRQPTIADEDNTAAGGPLLMKPSPRSSRRTLG